MALSTLLITVLFHPLVVYPLTLILLAAGIAWAYYEWKEYQTQNECRRRGIPYARIPSQFLSLSFGNRFDLVENDFAKRFGKVFGQRLWSQFTITISDPELVQIVCTREFTKMSNRRNFQSTDPVFDSILFSANGDKWKRIRAIVSPTFSAGKLRKVKFCIDETVQIMIKHMDENLKKSNLFKVKETLGAFTMDTICRMAFGAKVDSLKNPDNPIIVNVKKVFSQDTPISDLLFFWASIAAPWLVKMLNLRFIGEALDYFSKISQEIIDKKREELRQKQTFQKATNFIELILEVEREQQQADSSANGTSGGDDKPFKYITDAEMLGQCVTFFLVGYDTTATTLTNTLHILASNPDKQEILYKDIVQTLDRLSEEMGGTKDPFELITFDTINRFEYLNAVVSESLRLHVVATATERESSVDMPLETSDGKTRLDCRKGDIIRILISRMHEDPENFSRPDEFIPERFLPEDQQPADLKLERFNKYAYIPFGTGPRNCLARSLALLETKMALVHLVHQYRFDIDEVSKSKMDYYIQADLLLAKDVLLRYKKRQ